MSAGLQTSPEYKFVTREGWGAVPSLSLEKFRDIPYFISLTYVTPKGGSGDEKELLRVLQKQHMEEFGFPDIQCNFIIGLDGTVYEGRGWDYRPSLSQESSKRQRDFHGQFVEFMYLGDVAETDLKINPQMRATTDLIMVGIDKMKLPLSVKFLDADENSPFMDPLFGPKQNAEEI